MPRSQWPVLSLRRAAGRSSGEGAGAGAEQKRQWGGNGRGENEEVPKATANAPWLEVGEQKNELSVG